MVKILVVEDHPIVRKGVIRALEQIPGIEARCDEAADAQEAMRLAASGDYSLVLLDIAVPGASGLDLLKKLHRDRPKVPILILSIYPEDHYAIRALTLGAAGYLTKERAPDDLAAAARKLLAGGRYISASLGEQLASHLGPAVTGTTPPHQSLSDREFAVLRLIGAGRTPREIAGSLFLSVKTVGTYRSRILQKMNLKTSAELMSYAVGNDLVG